MGHYQASQSWGRFGFWQDPHSSGVKRLRSIFKVKLNHCKLHCVKRSYNLRKCLDLQEPQLSAEQRLATGLAWWWIWCISIMSTADFRIKRTAPLRKFEPLNEWNTENDRRTRVIKHHAEAQTPKKGYIKIVAPEFVLVSPDLSPSMADVV